MRAVILAAGEGSRLRPLTVDKPKPMIRAANKPILQHVVEALTANGVKDITIVLGYQRAKVQSYFGDGRKFGARITYTFQDVAHGTAAALALVPRPDDAFLVLGGDNLVDPSLLKQAISAPGDGPAVVLHQSESPQRYGVVRLDGDLVGEIVEKPRDPRSEWVNTGVYRFPAVFHDKVRALAEAGVLGLPDVLQAAIREGTPVRAVRSEHLWADAVYPWDLLRMHNDLLRAGAGNRPAFPGVHVETSVMTGHDISVGAGTHLGAGTCVGDNVVIGANCVLENCVIYDDAQIGPATIMRNTIVGEGARLGPRTTALSGACDVRTSDGWHHLEDFGSVIGEDVRLEGVNLLTPGTILGNKARVSAGARLSGRYDDGANVVQGGA